MLSAAAELPILNVKRKHYTLIPSRFPPVDLFERLSILQSDAIASIEELTNPRLRERNRLIGPIHSAEPASPHLQNWNHAPFTYSNPEGSRFFGSEHQVLELADTLQTALAISVSKRERFLTRTNEEPIDLDMRVLSRVVKGRFLDATGWPPHASQVDCRERGLAVLEAGVDGLVYQCPERPSARCIAILNGQALERAVQEDHFRFVWDGRRIKALYAFRDGAVIKPEQLGTAETVLAA